MTGRYNESETDDGGGGGEEEGGTEEVESATLEVDIAQERRGEGGSMAVVGGGGERFEMGGVAEQPLDTTLCAAVEGRGGQEQGAGSHGADTDVMG